MTKVHLLTFATEGPPADSGRPIIESAERFRRAASRWFDSAEIYTPRILKGIDSDWTEFVQDVSKQIRSDKRFRETLPWNENWAQIGLFRWKPRLILHKLLSNKTNDDDIVLYHDPDVSKYPVYMRGIRHWKRWLQKRMSNLDVLAFNDHDGARLFEDIKPELIDFYLPQKEVEHLEHLWAGAIAVRKNGDGIKFVRTWAEHSTFEAVSPFTKLPPPEGFAWNSCDQAVLTVLWHSSSFLETSIRREIQPLFRTRIIPPPSNRIRRIRKKAKALRRMFRTIAS